MRFRVTCPHCDSAAFIYASRDVSKDIHGIFVKDLYVKCKSDKCQKRFVLNASYSHDLPDAVPKKAPIASPKPQPNQATLL